MFSSLWSSVWRKRQACCLGSSETSSKEIILGKACAWVSHFSHTAWNWLSSISEVNCGGSSSWWRCRAVYISSLSWRQNNLPLSPWAPAPNCKKLVASCLEAVAFYTSNNKTHHSLQCSLLPQGEKDGSRTDLCLQAVDREEEHGKLCWTTLCVFVCGKLSITC